VIGDLSLPNSVITRHCDKLGGKGSGGFGYDKGSFVFKLRYAPFPLRAVNNY